MNELPNVTNGTNLFSDVTTIDGLMALPKDFFIYKIYFRGEPESI